MSSIMIDNMSLENAFRYLWGRKKNENSVDSYIDLIMAIVLWDELWYYDRRKSTSIFHEIDTVLSSLKDILIRIDHSMISYDSLEIISDIAADYVITSNDLHGFRQDDGAVFYGLLSNALKINVILHPSRRMEKEYFDRLDIFNKIDDEVKEYYESVNAELGRNLYTFKYPVLYDFIMDSAGSETAGIKAALELRQSKDVIQFRDEITHLEHVVNGGDIAALKMQLKQISKLTQDITNRYERRIDVGDLSISTAPALIWKLPIKASYNTNMKIHTTFIRNVIDFAVSHRSKYKE